LGGVVYFHTPPPRGQMLPLSTLSWPRAIAHWQSPLKFKFKFKLPVPCPRRRHWQAGGLEGLPVRAPGTSPLARLEQDDGTRALGLGPGWVRPSEPRLQSLHPPRERPPSHHEKSSSSAFRRDGLRAKRLAQVVMMIRCAVPQRCRRRCRLPVRAAQRRRHRRSARRQLLDLAVILGARQVLRERMPEQLITRMRI
jgi:hypothetical protein